VTSAYFEGFLRQNRPKLGSLLDRQLSQRNRSGSSAALSSGDWYACTYMQFPDL
jgi:hypothetical protein